METKLSLLSHQIDTISELANELRKNAAEYFYQPISEELIAAAISIEQKILSLKQEYDRVYDE
jgi:uncharacterized protein YutE (UPF0331/DUF86 family)